MIYENDKYFVQKATDALGEDGNYGREGYAVVNKVTGVVEHTTTVLPQALFQADAFMGALTSMDDPDGEDATMIENSGDVTLQ